MNEWRKFTFGSQLKTAREQDHQKIDLLGLLYFLSREDVAFLVEHGQKVLAPLSPEKEESIKERIQLNLDVYKRLGLKDLARMVSMQTGIPMHSIINYMSSNPDRYEIMENAFGGEAKMVQLVPSPNGGGRASVRI